MKIDLQLWYINRSVIRGTPTPRRFSHNSGVIEGLFDLNDRFSGIDIAEEIGNIGIYYDVDAFISCERKTGFFSSILI